MRPLPVTVETPLEMETAYGGRTVAWTAPVTVWVELDAASPQESGGGDRPPERSQTATARARAREHPALSAGVRLTLPDGVVWTVRAVRPDNRPGRVVVDLDRLL